MGEGGGLVWWGLFKRRGLHRLLVLFNYPLFFQKNSSNNFPKLFFLYLYMHNSHFILFCLFSFSSVFNMSLDSGSEDYANTSYVFEIK